MRRNKRVKISLFSFQDIITTITGVIILVTLLMALDLVRQPGEASPPAPAEAGETPADLTQRLARLEAASEVLAQQLEELRARARQAAAASPQTLRQLEQQRDRLVAQAEALRNWHAQQAPQTQRDIARLEAEHARLQQELAARNAELAKVQRSARRTAAGLHRLYRFRPTGAKTWWIVDVGPTSWQLWEIDRQGRPTGRRQVFAQPKSNARLNAMESWLAGRSGTQEAFFLLARPSAVRDFDRLRDALRERGFPLGFDLLGEGQTFDLAQP